MKRTSHGVLKSSALCVGRVVQKEFNFESPVRNWFLLVAVKTALLPIRPAITSTGLHQRGISQILRGMNDALDSTPVASLIHETRC